MPKENSQTPVRTKQVRRRKAVIAEATPPGGKYSLLSFALPAGDDVELVRDRERPDAYHVMVSTRADGVRATPVLERVPVEPIGKAVFEQFGHIRELGGYRPEHVDLRAVPRMDKTMPLALGEGEDRPVNVFPPDTRYVYQDTSFPWRTVGRVWTGPGSGTGCSIGPRLVSDPEPRRQLAGRRRRRMDQVLARVLQRQRAVGRVLRDRGSSSGTGPRAGSATWRRPSTTPCS